MDKPIVVSLLGLILLVGCAGPLATLDTSPRAVLSVQAQVQAGGYCAQAVVNPYGQADINHLQVKLFKVVASVEIPVNDGNGIQAGKDIQNANLSTPVVFDDLEQNTIYRIRAYAYSDAATASLISTTSGSYVDVTLTNNDRPTLATLQVQLIDHVFSGQATSSLSVTNGSLVTSGMFGVSNYYMVSALAGTAGTQGSTDATGTAARFNNPMGMAMDGCGNVYVADTLNNTIRKITPAGIVTTLAGTAGTQGSTDGTGTAARFNNPMGVAADSNGNVYVTEWSNHTIRKITPAGIVTTLAGTAGTYGSVDATGLAASFNYPFGVAVDGGGNVYVADTYNNTIRKITSTGVVATLAGNAGTQGSMDATGVAARFYHPEGVAVDGSGNVYVADTLNDTIRKITPAGIVTTLAGTAGTQGSTDGTGAAARFYMPIALAVDISGNVYVTEVGNNTIRKITSTGVVTTLAGSAGTQGSTDGNGTTARFYHPEGVAVDSSGNIYVADTYNDTIRKLQ